MTPTAHMRSAARRQQITDDVLARGAVAVVRLSDAGNALAAIDAVRDGGVTAVELTMTTPGAAAVIEALARRDDGLLVGAGSVLDAIGARRAIEAGAAFVVSPVFRADVLAEAHRAGVPAMPGAFTPTEILAAHEAGADVVKVFPADALGPAFVRGVLGPLPFLRLMPTGGVTPDNVAAWLRAGAAAVGLGSALVDPALVAAGDYDALRARARAVAAGVAAARGARA